GRVGTAGPVPDRAGREGGPGPHPRPPRRPGPLPPPGRPRDQHHHRPDDHLHRRPELAPARPRRHRPGRRAAPPPAHLRAAPRRPRPRPLPLPVPRLRSPPHRPAPHPVLEQRRDHQPRQPHQLLPPPPPPGPRPRLPHRHRPRRHVHLPPTRRHPPARQPRPPRTGRNPRHLPRRRHHPRHHHPRLVRRTPRPGLRHLHQLRQRRLPSPPARSGTRTHLTLPHRRPQPQNMPSGPVRYGHVVWSRDEYRCDGLTAGTTTGPARQTARLLRRG